MPGLPRQEAAFGSKSGGLKLTLMSLIRALMMYEFLS
jgi:hypothetical protein